MRIACPDCAAEYEVPDHLLVGAPRTMRCARCGRVWTPRAINPPAPDPALELESEQPVVPLPERLHPVAVVVPAAPAGRPRRTWLLLAWLFTIAMIVGIAVGTVTRRDQIVQAWPPAERAYRVIGL